MRTSGVIEPHQVALQSNVELGPSPYNAECSPEGKWAGSAFAFMVGTTGIEPVFRFSRQSRVDGLRPRLAWPAPVALALAKTQGISLNEQAGRPNTEALGECYENVVPGINLA